MSRASFGDGSEAIPWTRRRRLGDERHKELTPSAVAVAGEGGAAGKTDEDVERSSDNFCSGDNVLFGALEALMPMYTAST